MDQFRLNNKIALVSGGSKGIGLGIATALAEAGSDLVLVARVKKRWKKPGKSSPIQGGKSGRILLT